MGLGEKIIEQKRHEEHMKELSDGFGKLLSVIKGKTDEQIIAEIKNQHELIKGALSEFVSSVSMLENKELKVEVKNEEIVSSFKQIGEWIVNRIENSNNNVIQELKKKPSRLVAERNGRNGEIEAIVIEYKN